MFWSTPRSIVVICGQVPTTAIGTDAFQEAPVPSIMGAVAKHVFLVTDPTKLEATGTAFEIARTGRPGPVVSDVPKRCAELERRISRFRKAADSRIPAAYESPRSQQIAGTGVRRFLCRIGRREAAADLCGRRRHQRQRGARRARIFQGIPNTRRHHADGNRRRRHHAPAVHAHARHARHGIRQLCGR